MCNKPPCRQAFQCPPVVTNVVKQPGEYWQRSQIGCNSPEHSGPLWDKSQTLGSALAPLSRQQPHRTVAVSPSVGCYWNPLASQLFGSPVYCRWAPWGVFVYCRRLDKAHKGDLLQSKNADNCHFVVRLPLPPGGCQSKGPTGSTRMAQIQTSQAGTKTLPEQFPLGSIRSTIHIFLAG